MKYAASIAASLGLAASIFHGSVQAQTTANGPYYATPSWDQTLAAGVRFVVLTNFDSAAVLDRETGLVWLRSFPTETATFSGVELACGIKAIAGRRGWRPPSLQEFTSLLDGFGLPAGHPFLDVPVSYSWTSTPPRTFTNAGYVYDLNAAVSPLGAFPYGTSLHYTCVRGPA